MRRLTDDQVQRLTASVLHGREEQRTLRAMARLTEDVVIRGSRDERLTDLGTSDGLPVIFRHTDRDDDIMAVRTNSAGSDFTGLAVIINDGAAAVVLTPVDARRLRDALDYWLEDGVSP